jgi:hypothetical protein
VVQGLVQDAQTAAFNAGQSETNAATSAGQAEAAASQIVNAAQVNIPTLNNVLRANGTLFESIADFEMLRRADAFRRSPIHAHEDLGSIIHWDNSKGKPNTNPYTTSDSGATYTRISGSSNLQISNGKISAIGPDDIWTIPTGGVGSVAFKVWSRIQPGNRLLRLYIGKDLLNHVIFEIGGSNTVVNVIVGGVSTNVFTINTNAYFRDSFILSDGASIDLFADITLTLFQGSINQPFNRLSLFIDSQTFPYIRRSINLNAFISTFLSKTDISFCGFARASASNPISSWSIKSVSP